MAVLLGLLLQLWPRLAAVWIKDWLHEAQIMGAGCLRKYSLVVVVMRRHRKQVAYIPPLHL